MKPGWYQTHPLRLLILGAKEWATQMGYEGKQHRDEVRKLVQASLADIA